MPIRAMSKLPSHNISTIEHVRKERNRKIMWTKIATAAILIVAIIVLVAWDIYVAANGVKGDTISEIALDFARRHPVIPFAVGIVCGHLFWPQN